MATTRKPRGPNPKTVFGKHQSAAKPKPRKRKPARINPLYDPLATLRGPALKKAAQQITNAQYGPIIGGLNRQLTSTTTQGTALAGHQADYYRQMAEDEAKSVARQQAIGQLAQSQIGAASSTAQAALGAAADQAQQHVAADEAVRGKGLEGANATAAADELRHAAGVDASAGQSAAGLAALSAQDFAQLQEGMRSSRVARGGEEQTRLLNRLANQQQEIRAKRADTEAAKGGDFVKQLLGLRQQGFENEATRQGLNLKNLDIVTSASAAAAKRRQDARDKAAGRRVTQRGQDVTARGQDIAQTNAQTNAQLHRDALNERVRHDKEAERIAAINKAKGGPKEPASALAIRKSVGSITGWIKEIMSRPGNKGLTRAQLADQVRVYVAHRKLGSVPDYTLTPALDLVLDGHISPHTRQILQGYGVNVDALAPYATKRKPARRT